MDSIYLQIKYNDFMSLMSIDVFALKSNNFNKKAKPCWLQNL